MLTTLASKPLITGLVVSALLVGGYIWRLEAKLESATGDIGKLTTANAQLKEDLRLAGTETKAARAQMDLWRSLYGDLQAGYKDLQEQRQVMDAKLQDLLQQEETDAYLNCTQPDPVYDWLRNN